jgi:aminoglycoside phosphotransferase (APT) family kinase protein
VIQAILRVMENRQAEVDTALVRRLILAQFPVWANEPIEAVVPGGWDNRTFRLGSNMLVRLPSAACYAGQVEKEHRWLPVLAAGLPQPIPTPLAHGKPSNDYPWQWSIYRWLDGAPAASAPIADTDRFAIDLAQFLCALQRMDATGGPASGEHNFYRGGALTHYDGQTREAISALKNRIDTHAATQVWETALASDWTREPVWVHGDISAGNLLVRDGKLAAVIDFGMLGVGDPACDLAIAWTFFRGKSRDVFRASLALDDDTWARGRAWALWKALIVADKLTETNAVESKQAWVTVVEVLAA